MSKLRLLKLFVVLTPIWLASSDVLAQSKKVPRFADYQVGVSRLKSRQPNLNSHKDARLFRTNLRNAARNGTNFAGRYALTYWGCGSSCGVGAVVDLRNGRVYFPKQLDGVWAGHGGGGSVPFDYRTDSRLLILKGFLPGDYHNLRTTYGVHYFVWEGRRLRRVRFVPKDWTTGE
jgi:hypothetical protein